MVHAGRRGRDRARAGRARAAGADSSPPRSRRVAFSRRSAGDRGRCRPGRLGDRADRGRRAGARRRRVARVQESRGPAGHRRQQRRRRAWRACRPTGATSCGTSRSTRWPIIRCSGTGAGTYEFTWLRENADRPHGARRSLVLPGDGRRDGCRRPAPRARHCSSSLLSPFVGKQARDPRKRGSTVAAALAGICAFAFSAARRLGLGAARDQRSRRCCSPQSRSLLSASPAHGP